MGRFVPAIPLQEADFSAAGIIFNEARFCEPFEKDVPDELILFKDEDGYHFRVNMQQINSFKSLPADEQQALGELYRRYFYEMQDAAWKEEGRRKLAMLTKATDLLVCAEDLGMVPEFTKRLLHSLNMLSLVVQQMPTGEGRNFSDVSAADYLCVVMPATHDMPPLRLWWEQDRVRAEQFFRAELRETGDSPYFCEPMLCEKVICMHLASPAMWSIFLWQDLLAMNGKIRRPVPAEERINDPANADQVWNYRMHLTLEKLIADKDFSGQLAAMVKESGR